MAVETDVKLWCDSYEIPGILALPESVDSSEGFPAVLLLHGTGGNKDEVGGLYKRLADRLSQGGIASLRIDFIGCGDSREPHVNNNLHSSIQNVHAALRLLHGSERIDGSRVGLVGYSQGGRIAQMVAGREPNIKALVTWASASGNGYENFGMFWSYRNEAMQNGQVTITTVFGQQLHLGKEWFEAIEQSRALDDIANYHGPLLALHGSEDTIVPPDLSRELIRHAGGNDITLRMITGGNHGFNVYDEQGKLAENQSIAEELLELSADWLSRQL